MMDTLRQGIAARQAGREILCQGLDRAHFQGEPAIGDGRGEAAGLLEQVGSAAGEAFDGPQQRWRGACRRKVIDGGALRRQRIERDVDAIESPMITVGFTPRRAATMPLGMAPKNAPAGYAAASTPAPVFPSPKVSAK